MEYLAETSPELCNYGYGPRLCVKFYPADRFGTADETKLYRALCKISMWGGEDRVYRAKVNDDVAATRMDLQEILVFEFPYPTPQPNDSTLTTLMRRRYQEACEMLDKAGYRRLDNDLQGSEEFFQGFNLSIR